MNTTNNLIKELRKNAQICRDEGVMVTASLLMDEAANRLAEYEKESTLRKLRDADLKNVVPGNEVSEV